MDIELDHIEPLMEIFPVPLTEVIDESQPVDAKKKRPNWTELEKKILVQEVNERENVLFGKFKGPGGGKAAKTTAWQLVADAVNGSSGLGYHRTGAEANKQYANLKQRAKGKLAEMRRPKTGGGPKPASPSPAEQTILDNMDGRPSLDGVIGGVDTSADTEVPFSSTTCSGDASTCAAITSNSTAIFSNNDNICSSSCEKDKIKKKRNITNIELQVLEEERNKFKEEVVVLDLKKQKLSLEIEVLNLRKSKLIEEIELIRLQKKNL